MELKKRAYIYIPNYLNNINFSYIYSIKDMKNSQLKDIYFGRRIMEDWYIISKIVLLLEWNVEYLLYLYKIILFIV